MLKYEKYDNQGAIMSYIIDKIILIFLSAFLIYSSCSIDRLVIYILIGVIFACINGYFENRKLDIITGIIYIIMLLAVPEMILIAPIVLYDLFEQKLYVIEGIIGVLLLRDISEMGVITFLFLVLMIALSYILFYKSNRNEILNEQIKHIRDDSEERNLLLSEKNKHLIEKQNQDIYVATLKERNRIARDIHDNVGHMITRSILQMGALMTINKEEPLHGQLKSVKENLDVAMNNIRESVHDLHDESIDLRQAIDEILDTLKGKYEYNLDYDVSNVMNRSYKYTVIGVLKEAVSNIVKHSINDRVDIVIREHPAMYQIIVHDYSINEKNGNNRNLTENIIKTDGIGISNMHDRVRILHGNITINTEHGFKVFVTLPKNNQQEDT